MPSYISGWLIGLSAYISRQTEAPWNAILFGVGLLTICTCKLPLFTGKVGALRIRSANDLMDITLMLLFNWCGAMTLGFLSTVCPADLFAGIVCGTLIQMAVALYQKHPWAVVYCITAFIMAGGKHCIAMMAFPADVTPWTLVQVVCGNILGAVFAAAGGVRRNK